MPIARDLILSLGHTEEHLQEHVRMGEDLLLPDCLSDFSSKLPKPSKLVCFYPGVLIWNAYG